MRLVYSLLFVVVFALIFTPSIRKNSKIYYSIATALASATIVYEIYRLITDTKLQGFIGEFEKAFMKGNVSIGFFILVMFAGALNPRWKLTKKLLSIRAESAILACILLIPHGVMYAVRFINKILVHKPITALYVVYLMVGLVAFVMMIPLFITSFKSVRAKMTNKEWKRLQRWAYPFYLLTYIHILLALLNDDEVDIMKLSIYTVLFVGYFIMKLIKNSKLKNKNSLITS